jgi:preprotein translocase subunit SecG
MITVILVLHILLAVALIGVVLLQKSEGGALGIGGGGAGGGSLFSSRGAANVLTRATAILAAGFIGTSVSLAIMAGGAKRPASVIETTAPASGAPVSGEGAAGAPTAPQPAGPAVPLSQ